MGWAIAILILGIAGDARANDCDSAHDAGTVNLERDTSEMIRIIGLQDSRPAAIYDAVANLYNNWAIDKDEAALTALLQLDPARLPVDARRLWTGDLARIAQETRDPAVAARAESLFRAQLTSDDRDVRSEALLGLADLARHLKGESGRLEALGAAVRAEPVAWNRVSALFRIEFIVKAEIRLNGPGPVSGRYIAWAGPFALDLIERDPDARVRRRAQTILNFISR